MNRLAQDFVSEEPRKFHIKLGHSLASSLAGFVIGVIAASIVWLTGLWYTGQIQSVQSYSLNNMMEHTSSPVVPPHTTTTHKAPTPVR